LVQSSVREGSTFLIELPLSDPPFPTDASPGAPAPPLARKRVLVIKSDEKNLALLQEVVRHLGHEVEGVYSAQELLERIVRQPYDLLMARINLPHIDGPTLYRQVNQLRAELARRTIFIADDVPGGEISRFLDQVSCSLLRKPFSLADLDAIMRRALEP
jgi:CheY-like chemotaxis protein